MGKRIKRGVGKIVWMDPFDTRCCTKSTLAKVAGFYGGDGSWVVDFMAAPEKFIKGKAFVPYRCKNCGRYWFRFVGDKRCWTVK